MLDMDRRVRPVRKASFAVLALALLACGPWMGWWTIVPLGLAAALFWLAERSIDRSVRADVGLFAAWAASQAIIAVSIAITGGATMPTMSWFAIPLVTLSARFSERGIALGVGITLALIFAVAFGVDPQAVIDQPPLLIAPVAMVLAVSMLQTVLMRSDVESRARSVVDPLTGLLNRQALAPRVAELTQQAQISREPIGLILCDLDHFKAVNDRFGHAAGDAVLSDVAGTLRRAMRAFDLIYRIGGEEFLVLLPGADREASVAIAEDLRAAVEARAMGASHPVTVSCGVTASPAGAPFDYDALFAEADAALYAAKHAGRNCVRAPGSHVQQIALAGDYRSSSFAETAAD